MAGRKATKVQAAPKEVTFDPGEANPKQREFFESTTRYTCYGGAKGGGKTWALRTKASLGALMNPGIRILIVRAHYPELENNHIIPMKTMMAPLKCSSYNGSSHIMTFDNGSYIKF